jgi:decaprenylphospho-beta-D-erythro-pentofuranosid-2-ulose 2-reductase
MSDALGRFRRVLVLGGGSEIAEATVRALLRRHGPMTVVLATRPGTSVDTAALERAGATVVRLDFEAREHSTHETALAPAFAGGDVDLVLLAFGVLGEQALAEGDARSAVAIADTNFTAAVSALTVVANHLRGQGHGTIVVLSSVAAQRPRASNYVYGASKAGLDAFARGLQLTAARDGLRVMVVRPGFVRTAMTAHLPPAPFSVDAERTGVEIAAALEGKADIVWIPRILRPVMWLLERSPRSLMQRM